MAKVSAGASGTENASPRRSQGPSARRQPTVTELKRTWEAKLRSEGMPPEVKPLTSRHPGAAGDFRGAVFPLKAWHIPTGVLREVQAVEVLADNPLAIHWARFSQAAYDLPRSWGRRRTWLIAFGEMAQVRPVCRKLGVRPDDAYRWLREFAAWRLVNGC